MRPVNIKKLNYKDELGRRHRRFLVLKIVVMVLGTIVVVIGLIYLLFFSRMFDVREVSFNGLDTTSSDVLKSKIDENLNQKILKYLPRRNNIFFVNTGKFEKEFASAYPVFKSVNIRRKLLHGLVLNFLERKPAGIWCFASIGSAQVSRCQYFDEEKVLWGQPAKSSGFIFLTVEDNRQIENGQIDNEFFRPIMEVAKSMAGEIKNVIIPENSFNEFRVYTARSTRPQGGEPVESTDYYIIFTTDSDAQNQLDILKIFMNEKGNDSDFHPQYIDLRVDGRVYYKQ